MNFCVLLLLKIKCSFGIDNNKLIPKRMIITIIRYKGLILTNSETLFPKIPNINDTNI